ncbi:MAG: hypothetical protein QMD85_01415 [Candidatus Aenigmarchaeota archaeon]|nr:hypothetical protein [Candidatus Aenigmarchaeota archaeon]
MNYIRSISRQMMHGSRQMMHGTRHMMHGSRHMMHGSRQMMHGSRQMMHGTRQMMHGSRHMMHGSRHMMHVSPKVVMAVDDFFNRVKIVYINGTAYVRLPRVWLNQLPEKNRKFVQQQIDAQKIVITPVQE